MPGDGAACVRRLLADLELSDEARLTIDARARRLVEAVRSRRLGEGLDAFLHAYGLSTQEGVLLMCIAEALLRIPDERTRERLIRDKLAAADWEQHLGRSASVLVNASTWALMLTGRLVRLHDEAGHGVAAAMRRLMARLGEPVVREAVTQAMRILGRQFVMAATIEQAIDRAQPMQRRGWRFSYDMLGESARTMRDAERYAASYARAIAAIGAADGGNAADPRLAPGISVKLSALHPRFEEAQVGRVRDDLVPRVRALAQAAAGAGIGLTIDAEEGERLAVTLDVIEAVAADPDLAGWEGLGAVVQTYLRAAPVVLDRLATTARRSGRRLMLRLVKGAYWDAEIKRAQELGLDAYPVFTRKATTDVSYLACAKLALAAPEAFYPQFATHNAHTIAAVLELAGKGRDLEFQRLHGMGDALYEQLIEHEEPGIGARIYAPVGAYEDLLAYLVRRLLENGANSSFVNRMQDDRLPIEAIVADPVVRVRGLTNIANPRIPSPREMYLPQRLNAYGVDFADRAALASLAEQMTAAEASDQSAGPIVGGADRPGMTARDVLSPADRRRRVGHATEATAADVEKALSDAAGTAADWAGAAVETRAACLERAADLLEAETPALMTLLVREAGKTVADAMAEVREAADFCRYYAARGRLDLGRPLSLPLSVAGVRRVEPAGGGVIACISPWNFPLAIFTGQVTAALLAGNAVIAKPAEQTPLIAAAAVRLLHRAGIPPHVLHLLPGDGARVGGALVADHRVAGVVFTGSIDTARSINQMLAGRASAASTAPPLLIAETGGQNAMIVDSSALPEQVTRDALASAFRSAGQRCSALRLLFVQEDVAPKIIDMLAGAMDELRVGDPALLSTDVGPVIDAEAQTTLETHIARMREESRLLARARLGADTATGSFVAPTLVEIDAPSRLRGEVFGPVLHVVRWRADRLPQVLSAIEATGYGLTLGVQSRIDETQRFIFGRTSAGNVYVNRNQIGAIVGVQPFGGGGLSGTGPKAGGPAYLHRLVAHHPVAGEDALPEAATPAIAAAIDADALLRAKVFDRAALEAAVAAAAAAGALWRTIPAADRADLLRRTADWLAAGGGDTRAVAAIHLAGAHLRAHWERPLPLPGPTGERNELSVRPLGVLACLGADTDAAVQIAAVAAALAAGNSVLLCGDTSAPMAALQNALAAAGLPAGVLASAAPGGDASLDNLLGVARLAGAIIAAPRPVMAAVGRRLAHRDGAILPLIPISDRLEAPAGIGAPALCSSAWFERFVHERTLTIDTTASGGNAALLSLNEDD
ncbi:MAG: bifunctional proline dehydrogenase/L-glutamate gamma-semialdehyde dehydrogenase PutA [Rhodospirillales bacterium]|nr:bifunctional proline dehydrogenase/L-glutamate gamma-semialdehyde dehydrogenase PutA [Rhodospirillales bacterium]